MWKKGFIKNVKSVQIRFLTDKNCPRTSRHQQKREYGVSSEFKYTLLDVRTGDIIYK
jgi:hypothetical protein